MKKFDLDDVYSSDTLTEDLVNLIGTYGYFSRKMSDYSEDWTSKKQLRRIMIDEKGVYFVADTLNTRYQYFLPVDKVKEVEEPRYRPFTLEEFLKRYKVGQVVHIRPTDDRVEEQTLIIAIFPTCTNCVCFGSMLNAISLDDLFEGYEIEIDGKWQPFGVLEND